MPRFGTVSGNGTRHRWKRANPTSRAPGWRHRVHPWTQFLCGWLTHPPDFFPVVTRPDRPGPGPAGTLAVVPLECLFTTLSALRTLSTAGTRIAGNSGIGMYLGFLFGFGGGQADHRCMHVAIVTVPSSYPFLPNLGLSEVQHFPPTPPCYRSWGIHACCRGVYYSRCSLYIALYASHTLDRVPHPLIRNSR